VPVLADRGWQPRWLLAVPSVVLAVTAGLARAPVARTQPTTPVAVSVGANTVGGAIGPHFLGLSFEESTLPIMARDAARGNLVGLLRSLGPGVARFGGISADLATTFSTRPGARQARAATAPLDFLQPVTITPADFDRLGTLLRAADWTALLTVPLARYDPARATREALAASRGLGRELVAIEVGNEPNAYPLTGLRASTWTFSDYLDQFRAYARHISAAVPTVRFAGPDPTQGNESDWLAQFARDARPAVLTPHFYALSACSDSSPTLEDLFTPALATGQVSALARLGTIGREYRIAVRLAETNNVACQGQAGVSNTFGSALWAIRQMLDAARAGISGVNYHTLPESCFARYSPICARTPSDYIAGRFRVMPEWYALLFVRQLVGDRLRRTVVAGLHPGLTVDALVSRPRRRLDFVLVNTDSTTTYQVRLRVPAMRAGGALRLLAPTLDATSGVTLGGTQVTRATGAWRPDTPLRPISRVGSPFNVAVRPASAVLVRLQARAVATVRASHPRAAANRRPARTPGIPSRRAAARN
jgi:hypothetical protein